MHWLPQETILFDGASMTRALEVDLAADARFLAVEAVLLGRRAMGERMITGQFRDRWRIRKGGRLLHADQLAFHRRSGSPHRAGSDPFRTGRLRDPASGRGRLRAPCAGPAGAACCRRQGAISHVTIGGQEKLIARLVAPDGFALRKLLVPMISHLRDGASVPKVWTL